MTTEDLGEGDHHAKLVYADYLEDRDDPRAEGFRALGTLRLDVPEEDRCRFWVRSPVGCSREKSLPPDWFEAVRLANPKTAGEDYWPCWGRVSFTPSVGWPCPLRAGRGGITSPVVSAAGRTL